MLVIIYFYKKKFQINITLNTFKTVKTRKKRDKDKIIFDNDIQDKVFVSVSYLIMVDKKNKI